MTPNPLLQGARKQESCHSELVSESHKSAFTLAEVLITLGIIGVVAAMTLPTLIQKQQEKILVTQVKKAYSELQNALKLYAAQNSCPDITCISDLNITSEELGERLYRMFAKAHKCPGDYGPNRKVCKTVRLKSNRPYYKDGVTASGDSFSPDFVAANGVAYQVVQYSTCPREIINTKRDENGNVVTDADGNPVTTTSISNTCAIFYMDANGVNKGPNQFGADVYRFDLRSTGKFESLNNMISPALTKDKLEYTPHEFGVPKK